MPTEQQGARAFRRAQSPRNSLADLRLAPRDWSTAAKAIVVSIVAVTAFILVLDGLLFRRALTPGYIAAYTSPLFPRTLFACLGSSIEEVKFRLIIMSLLVMLMGRWRRPLPPAAFVAAIVLCQFANVGGLVIAYPLYASLRFWAVGCIWGFLYWRHGWVAALIGHGTSHLLIDPLLALVLLHT